MAFSFSLEMSYLQLGQVAELLYQSSIQFLWNMCLQGVLLYYSPFTISDKHTEQLAVESYAFIVTAGMYLLIYLSFSPGFLFLKA